MEPTIPQHHIERLRGDPASAPAFDTKYGVGQAARLLAQPKDEDIGMLADAAKGALRGPLKALDETSDFIAAGINAVAGTEIEPLNYADVLAPPQTTAGEITQGVTQFVTGLAGLGKFTKLAKLDGLIGASKSAMVAGAAARSATVSAVAFDPFEGNVANFVERYPSLQNPVTEFLAVGEDDSDAEARLKNALADVAVGVPLDLAMTGLKAIRAKKQGRLEDAEKHLEDLADADGAPAAPEVPPADPAQAPAVPSPEGSRAAAVAGHVEGSPLREAGVAEQAAMEAKKLPQIPNPPVQLAPEVAQSLTNTIKLTVERDARRGGDPWGVFFREGHDFNVQKIMETSEGGARGALSIMEDIGETFRTQIDEARGGATRSFETVRHEAARMARMTGNDPGEFLDSLVRDAKTMKSVEARLYAYKNFTLSLADSVKRLAQMIEQGTHGAEFKSMDEVAVEFSRRAEFLANVQAMTKAVQSGSARAVSAGRMGAKVSPAMLKAIQSGNFASVGGDMATIQRMAKAVASASPEDALRITRMSLADRTGEAVYRYWINSILSGPATHIVNATSNFVKGAVQTGEEYLAGVYGGDAKRRATAAHTFAEMASQTVEAWRVARKALNAGENILDNKELVSDRQFSQVTAEQLAEAIEKGQYGGAILKAGHALFNYPTRLLASEDEFFKQVSYRARVTAKATVEGQAAGLKGPDLEAFVQQRMDSALNPTNGSAYDDAGKALDEDALRYAQEATFTQPLDPDGLAAGIQVFANRSPWMRLILPFIKTPANVLGDWAYRSGLHREVYRDLAAGGQRRATAAARLTTGAAFYSTASLLVESGAITGMGPQDSETKKLWKAAGNQPYSLKVGDKWIAYNRMDPFGMFFGIAADLGELSRHSGDRSADEMMEMALMSFSRNLSNKTYLRGIADVMDALFERGPQVDEKVARLMQGYASGFTPFSGYSNGIKDDPHMREVRSMADAAANRVPGMSAELDPQRNVLGEITMASEVGGISPWAMKTDKSDPLAEELVRVFEATGEKMQKPPKVTGAVDWTQFKNDKGRSAYDRYLELHSELGLRKALQGAMKNPTWDRLGDMGRVEAFRSVQSRVRGAARAKLFQEFPDLRDAVLEQERAERLSFLKQ